MPFRGEWGEKPISKGGTEKLRRPRFLPLEKPDCGKRRNEERYVATNNYEKRATILGRRQVRKIESDNRRRESREKKNKKTDARPHHYRSCKMEGTQQRIREPIGA